MCLFLAGYAESPAGTGNSTQQAEQQTDKESTASSGAETNDSESETPAKTAGTKKARRLARSFCDGLHPVESSAYDLQCGFGHKGANCPYLHMFSVRMHSGSAGFLVLSQEGNYRLTQQALAVFRRMPVCMKRRI